MSTFGFEAEFTSGARALIATLHREGWSTMDSLHDWHCIARRGPCVHCDFEGENRDGYRGQTDSSCDGEIISPVFGRDDHDDPEDFFSQAILALQQAAVETDAEPGQSAGMHVHVKPNDPGTMFPLTWEFARWEEVLKVLAAGPFSALRSGMNQNVSTHAQTWWEMYGMNQTGSRISQLPKQMEDMVGNPRDPNLMRRLYNHIHEADRHANLNFSDTHGTAEFRIWNSSRVAWRIRMYTGVTRLFADPEFLDAINGVPLEGSEERGFFTVDVPGSLAKLVEVIDTHDPLVAEQVVRQMEFQSRGEFARRFSDVPVEPTRQTRVARSRRSRPDNEAVYRMARPVITGSGTSWNSTSTGSTNLYR